MRYKVQHTKGRVMGRFDKQSAAEKYRDDLEAARIKREGRDDGQTCYRVVDTQAVAERRAARLERRRGNV